MGILKRQPFKQEQATLLHIYRSRHICGNWKKRKKGLAFLLVKNSTWAKLNSNMYKEKKKKAVFSYKKKLYWANCLQTCFISLKCYKSGSVLPTIPTSFASKGYKQNLFDTLAQQVWLLLIFPMNGQGPSSSLPERLINQESPTNPPTCPKSVRL